MKKHILRCACGVVPPLLLLALERCCTGTVGMLTADATLYLSVADNALATGHFIQTARDISGFVVPPGLPLCLLALRALGFSLHGLNLVQALLFGGSCLLLLSAGWRLLGRWGVAVPLIYALAYCRCRLFLGNLYVEHWYLFLLCLLVWLLFSDLPVPRRLLFMNLCALAALMTRPALAPVWLAVLLYTGLVLLRGRRPLQLALLLMLHVAVLGFNLLVNHRECGEWVLLENYAATDFYRAAAPGTSIRRSESTNFSDEFMDELEVSSLSMSERGRLLTARAWEYIRQNPLRYLRNGLARCFNLYLLANRFLPLLALPGAFLLARGGRRRAVLLSLAVALVTALLSGFGVPDLRYTMPVWPLASLHLAALPAAIKRRGAGGSQAC